MMDRVEIEAVSQNCQPQRFRKRIRSLADPQAQRRHLRKQILVHPLPQRSVGVLCSQRLFYKSVNSADRRRCRLIKIKLS